MALWPQGGLRYARLGGRHGDRLAATTPAVAADFSKGRGIDSSMSYTLLRPQPKNAPPTIAAITAAILHDEMNRKLGAISHAANAAAEDATALQGALYDISAQFAAGQSFIDIVDAMAATNLNEAPVIASLRVDFAASPTTAPRCKRYLRTAWTESP